jgi:hypothetical protein
MAIRNAIAIASDILRTKRDKKVVEDPLSARRQIHTRTNITHKSTIQWTFTDAGARRASRKGKATAY